MAKAWAFEQNTLRACAASGMASPHHWQTRPFGLRAARLAVADARREALRRSGLSLAQAQLRQVGFGQTVPRLFPMRFGVNVAPQRTHGRGWY